MIASANGRPRWAGSLAATGLGLLCSATLAHASAGAGSGAPASTVEVLLRWLPFLLQGFAFNLVISALAMAFGTLLGALLGLGLIGRSRAVRLLSGWTMNLFRNAPRLVILFMCMYLIPFRFRLGGETIVLAGWAKAVLGLSLAVMANVAEIVRGAVQSVPTTQWEAGEAFAFGRRQILWSIILPQCAKRMLPPWMSLYAIITMDTVLVSILGIGEVMTLTGEALSAENRPDLLLPFYGFVLLLFFAYCYPIARWTARLERRYAVVG